MNRKCVRLSALLPVVALLLGACAQAPAAPSASQPAPAASPTTGSEQQLPAATAQSTEPVITSTTAAPVEAAGSGVASEGTTMTIGTDNGFDNKFVPDTVQAPANTPVTLIFNNSSSQHHNLLLPPPISAKTKLVVAAGASDTLKFTTPAAGAYRFWCSIHPAMEGTLQVK